MRKIIGILVLAIGFGFTSGLSTQQVSWSTWNNGWAAAKQNNKIALIDAYTDWCGWCKKMDKTTYENELIVSKIKESFIPIKFNPELDGLYQVGDTMISGPQLLAALSQGKSSGFPTTFFYVPSTNQMYQYPGYQDATAFGKILDEMILAHAKGKQK
ncbi:MAG: hypothetical protein ACI8ZN_001047 [Bacteroidia bacterium]|jgi:uncharacterized protein YyaL (SSP411 family)